MAEENEGGGAEAGGLLSPDMAGRLLMVSGERVRQLAKEGWIRKASPGKYNLVEVVQGYIRFRNDADRRSTKTASDSRLRDARTREVELKTAQREGRLIELDDHLEAVDEIVGIMLTGLSGLPARVTRDLQVRRDIERAINETRQQIADAAAKATSRHRAAREASTTVADHDGGAMGEREPEASE
jgi:hypothetical protein